MENIDMSNPASGRSGSSVVVDKAVQDILDKADAQEALEKAKRSGGKGGINFKSLISGSPAFDALRIELKNAMKSSLTGMVNLVVNHDDPCLVEEFLKSSFKSQELYNNVYDICAVELQQGSAGKGFARNYLDTLIYGEIECKDDENGIPIVQIDPRNGERKRKPNGFVNRKEVLKGEFIDKTLIIKNLDFSLDFCQDESKCESPGIIDSRSLYLFDNFRNPTVKMGCRLLLISNVPLKLPFQISKVEFQCIDDYEANHIVSAFVHLYNAGGYTINFTKAQMDQMCRKITGLTYTEGADALGHSIAKNRNDVLKTVDASKVLKTLRDKINKNFMDDGHGLTHLSARPWEDYICPESSNFTYDVAKIMRDFTEIKNIRERIERGKSKNEEEDFSLIEAIQIRIPHVLVLHGKGGVGKCLGRGTNVLMYDGSIEKVENIRNGDLLMGPDSTPRTVMSKNYGIGPLYRVDQNNGDSYVCNDEHILSLKPEGTSNNDKTVFCSIKEYLAKNKTWKKTHYGWKSGVEFPQKPFAQDLIIEPYWMGLWLGDGNSYKTAITVADKDVEIQTWLELWAAKNDAFIRKEDGSGAKMWNFAYRQGSGHAINPILNSLRDLDVFNNKHIPCVYLLNSRENRLELLAGLIDSDGYKCESGSLQFTNVNKRLAEQVMWLARSLGFKAFWSESIKGIKERNYSVMAYTITIGGNLSLIPTKIARKKGHDNLQKQSLKSGISVTPIGVGEYFGFTLDGDHQFMLGDFTVTHNSAFPVHLAGLLDFDVWDFNINASHSKWIGEGSERMRDSIKKIMSASHLIVRIDEYDRAMGSTGEGGNGMHEAHKQVESEFMNWLQNSQEENQFRKQSIFLVLTTNHKENITGPLLRSGRADLVIDIDNFDAKSMKITMQTAARRMYNRGVKAIGFKSQEELQEAINSLDLDHLSELCTMKGFTVRDVEMLFLEMAAHNYYVKRGQEGLEWTTKNFIEVLEESQGSIRNDTTGELKLGDRDVMFRRKNPVSPSDNAENQDVFDFAKGHIYDPQRIGDMVGFKEV